MSGVWSNYRVFMGQFFRRYHTTGALLPSGRALASALCRYVRDGGGKRRILEVGPGTGAVTARLVRCLGPEDQLSLVELNDEFVTHLRRRFETDAAFRSVADRTEVIHGRLEDVDGSACFDRIISGLPLNNFAVGEVEQILSVFGRLLKPGGILSFFEYIGIRRAKQLLSGRRERERLQGVGRALGSMLATQEIRCDWVWPNFTPAWVHHVQVGSREEGA